MNTTKMQSLLSLEYKYDEEILVLTKMEEEEARLAGF